MWMANAVRVSRPSCLLMFLAASTTSCVLWYFFSDHSWTATSPYCRIPTCERHKRTTHTLFHWHDNSVEQHLTPYAGLNSLL